MLKKRSSGRAPSVRAASSRPRSIFSRERRMARTMQRKGHDRGGERCACGGEGELRCRSARAASRRSDRARRTAAAAHNRSATGGSTSGRCTKASSRVRPGKRARVSTQATRMASGRLKSTLRAATPGSGAGPRARLALSNGLMAGAGSVCWHHGAHSGTANGRRPEPGGRSGDECGLERARAAGGGGAALAGQSLLLQPFAIEKT